MIVEVAILTMIYAIWIIVLVNAMVSSEEFSLTIATLPFLVTFPIALLLAAILESYLPGVLLVDIVITVIVGVLLFVRWVMALIGE
jgi:hypothetical protein